jgi:hypothetical protein
VSANQSFSKTLIWFEFDFKKSPYQRVLYSNMQIKRFILSGLCLAIVTGELLGQTNSPSRKLLFGFDAASQTDVDVIASGARDEVPCPPEYTNVLSNTNLFTRDEQKLLDEIALVYGNETSNSVPAGSVMVDFHATPMPTSWGTNWLWVAHLKFTNTDLTDEITPGGDLFRHKVRNKDGDGYDFNITPTLFHPRSYGEESGPEFWFQQIKHGVKDGLYVNVIPGGHCTKWMQFSNGWAVDKKLCWAAGSGELTVWAKFKKPFDIDRTHDMNREIASQMLRAWQNNALNAASVKPPTSAEKLRRELEAAANSKDIGTIVSLICWDGQKAEVKDMAAAMLAMELAKSGTNTIKLKLVPVPVGFLATKSSFLPDWEGDNGMRGKYNIPVIGMIHVEGFGMDAVNQYPDIPYGKKGDNFYVAQMISYQIPGKALRVRVDNIPPSLTYTGYWTYVSNGKEITVPISDQTNQFREGWGDYVKYLRVQRTSTNETPGFAPFFQCKITEGQVTNLFIGSRQFTEEVPVVIFDSGEITDEKPIIYERK